MFTGKLWNSAVSVLTANDMLSQWGRVTHICVGNLTIIGSDNGLSPGRHQVITWTSVGILLIGPLGTNFSEMLVEIHTFSFKKIHLKMLFGKWQPFCLGLNVLTLELQMVPESWELQNGTRIWQHGRKHQYWMYSTVYTKINAFGFVLLCSVLLWSHDQILMIPAISSELLYQHWGNQSYDCRSAGVPTLRDMGRSVPIFDKTQQT